MFIAHGCAALIASVDRVDDGLVCLLMPRFYGRLVGGASVASALRQSLEEIASLSRSELYVFAEQGWPANPRTMSTTAQNAQNPYHWVLTRPPYMIYGDPALTLV